MAATRTYFTAKEIRVLRRRAARAAVVRGRPPEGWSKSSADPMRVLAVFTSLRVREGWVLRAYQYFSRGNGNAVVWALPADADFLDPREYAGSNGPLDPPRPPGALAETMRAIDGDGTPLSYLSASIFARELGEFGAFWHGHRWSTRSIVDADPSRERPDRWRWDRRRPADWRPCVAETARGVRVVFFSYGALGGETVDKHADTYRRSGYVFRTQQTGLALGGPGLVF